MAGENIVTLCDVDRHRLAAAAKEFPKAKTHTDLRSLLDEHDRLDGVVISTPDHTHAVATVCALQRGMHVYCEKPLTHWIGEARTVAEAAAKAKRVTQMGTGAQSNEGEIRTVEIIRSGVIGKIEAVHVWTNRPVWPQGQSRPDASQPAPDHLDWDCWLGPAPERPFVAKYDQGPFAGRNVYHPFVWRGWWDFGTGALGDIAPHAMNVVFWALNLGAPTRVEATSSDMMSEAFPRSSTIHFDFPAGEFHKPLRLTWYDGGRRPPAGLVEGRRVGGAGILFVGEKGKFLNDGLFPRERFADYQPPEPTLPRRIEIHADWIRAVKENDATGCPFDYAGPMTEAYLLGNVALRAGEPIEWDAANLRVTNVAEAQQYIAPPPRKGWELRA
ncbi:MAG TPA: hypothetical protein DD670_10800 [Planctomycetaceae bacterium]|nr:hypothetical protein [Planctomycetaceae bacterium]